MTTKNRQVQTLANTEVEAVQGEILTKNHARTHLEPTGRKLKFLKES